MKMETSRQKCLINPDMFCYICDEYTLIDKRLKVDDLVKTFYLQRFQVALVNQGKSQRCHREDKTCKKGLRKWTKDLDGAEKFS